MRMEVLQKPKMDFIEKEDWGIWACTNQTTRRTYGIRMEMLQSGEMKTILCLLSWLINLIKASGLMNLRSSTFITLLDLGKIISNFEKKKKNVNNNARNSSF